MQEYQGSTINGADPKLQFIISAMKSAMESNIELEATAYHEAGHAVAGFALKRAFAKVSIVPDDTTVGH